MSIISLTEKAASEIKKVMEEQGMTTENNVLRVGVTGGGCSGLNYSLEFIEKKDVDPLNDDQLNLQEIHTVVDRRAIPYLEGTIVDFHDGLNQRGFKFENPQSKGGCGCGQSFKVE